MLTEAKVKIGMPLKVGDLVLIPATVEQADPDSTVIHVQPTDLNHRQIYFPIAREHAFSVVSEE